MNNFWALVIVAVTVAGIMISGALVPQMRAPMAPQIYQANTLNVMWKAYRQATYVTEDQQASVVDLTGWKASFGSKALVVVGRFLYRNQVITYRRWRVIAPMPQDHPFLMEFDLDGNGTFSKSEGNVLIGDPLTSAPIPEAIYLAAPEAQTPGATQ